MVPVLAKNAVRIKCNFQNAGMTGNYECAYALGILNAQLGLPEITEYEDIAALKEQLLESSDKIELVHCVTGHNGLDFQLSTYLGYMLHDIASSEVIIVSNDTGFDAVVSFWAKKGMNIRRQSIDPQLY